jgi:hypothetical protein
MAFDLGEKFILSATQVASKGAQEEEQKNSHTSLRSCGFFCCVCSISTFFTPNHQMFTMLDIPVTLIGDFFNTIILEE